MEVKKVKREGGEELRIEKAREKGRRGRGKEMKEGDREERERRKVRESERGQEEGWR